MTRAALAIAGAALLGVASTAHAEVRVQIRAGEAPGQAAIVEFSADRAAWVALYGAFSDGSLRTLYPAVEGSAEWIGANESRVVSVEAGQGIHLESVQAVESPRWFDPRRLWIAVAPSDLRAGGVSTGNGEGLWS